MKKFCVHCGEKLKPTAKVCIHCGKKIGLEEQQKTLASSPEQITATSSDEKSKRKMTSAQKILLSIGLVVILLLLGGHLWANKHFSEETVEKQFEKAIEDKDIETLTNLVVHGNGEKIESYEADALIKLFEEEGNLNFLYHIESIKKFLGIYDQYQIQIVDQFIEVKNLEEISYTINDQEIALYEEKDNTYTLGPLAPGYYTLDISVNSDFEDIHQEEKILLNDQDGNIGAYIDIDISDVEFFIGEHKTFDLSDIKVQINEHTFDVNEDGYTDFIGPLMLDGSLEAYAVADLPWGKITSEPVQILNDYNQLNVSILNDEQEKEIAEIVQQFGEQIAATMVDGDKSLLENTSDNVKDHIASLKSSSKETYTGRLEKYIFREDAIELKYTDNDVQLSIPVRYFYEEDFHDLNEKPRLREKRRTYFLIVSYDQENQSWTIEDLEEIWLFHMGGTNPRPGSKKVYGPSDEDDNESEKNPGNEEEQDHENDDE